MMTFRDFIDNFEECAAVLLSVAMSIAVTLGVITRLIGAPLAWTNEVARYVFVWVVMMGAVVAVKRNGHIIIDVFINLFSEKVQGTLRFAGSILVILILSVLVYFGTVLAVEFWGTKMSLLPYPIGLVYASLPACSLLMILRMAQRLFREPRVRRPDDPLSKGAAR